MQILPAENIKILVVDDEASVREIARLYLEKEGFTVYEAADGDAALHSDLIHQPDLIVLDIMLPKLSGWEVCQALPRQIPVIFLTAKNEEPDKITGFKLGADDYITKPFSPRELVARVRAVLRRSGHLAANEDVLTFLGLVINPARLSVTIEGKEQVLTPKEFDLLLFLARHQKIVFSREQLLLNVWGYDFEGDERTVDATIKRLRKKIEHDHNTYIHTAWGTGYKFEAPPS